jgi:hypothetical protein
VDYFEVLETSVFGQVLFEHPGRLEGLGYWTLNCTTFPDFEDGLFALRTVAKPRSVKWFSDPKRHFPSLSNPFHIETFKPVEVRSSKWERRMAKDSIERLELFEPSLPAILEYSLPANLKTLVLNRPLSTYADELEKFVKPVRERTELRIEVRNPRASDLNFWRGLERTRIVKNSFAGWKFSSFG